MEIQISPVKKTALDHNIPVLQPEKIKHNLELREQLEDIHPEAIIVVAYGRIIPQWMLDLPPHGNINLHGSLLPKYRGAAPIQWAVASGEVITGVTTMRLDAGLDTGDMLLAQVCPIGLEETSVDVYECLADTGAKLMVRTLRELAKGTLYPQPQDHSLATLAPILTREDGLMDFTRTAKQLYDRWRGFQPWPGAHTTLRGKKLIAHKLHVTNETFHGQPGELIVRGDLMLVRCANSTVLAFDEVQLEGKRRMTAAAVLHGYQFKSGERLGILIPSPQNKTNVRLQ
jgi:methionyl-tRNA formyltransferase